MLKLENICYKNILRNINLEVQNGEFIYVTGIMALEKRHYSTLFQVY